MSPRKSVAESRRTRQRIVERGLEIASVDGLDGLTIGRLAAELDMSKAGVLGHFGSKESIQLAVIEAAAELFTREVADPAQDAAPGLPRLLAACEAWVSYLERDVLPGGCFFTAAAAEFDGRRGPVRDAIAWTTALWQRELRIHVWRAALDGDLPPGTDPAQLLYDVVAIMLALNHFRQLHGDQDAGTRARHSLRRLFGTGVKPAIGC